MAQTDTSNATGSSHGRLSKATELGVGGREGREDRLAKALGWFSVGLGVPQVVAPGRVNRLIGIDDNARNRAVMRAVGLRELAGAAGILDRPRPSGFLFARVTGDVMDLLILRAALGARGNSRQRVMAAAAAVAGVAVLDVIATTKTSRSASPSGDGAVRVRGSITVNSSPDQVYGHWRDLEKLPTFMSHLESVQVLGEGRSRWVARGPAGKTVEWDSEIVEDVPHQLIAWRSVEHARVPNSGSVRFSPAPGGLGTEVTVELEFRPPAGAFGAALTRLFGEEPRQQIKDDLRRFKQVVETGEVLRSEGSPDGTRTQRQFSQREAQPLGRGRDRRVPREARGHEGELLDGRAPPRGA